MQDENFTITNTTKCTLPRVPFLAIKNKALGKKYSLSLAFIGNTRSQKLNNAYRGKNKPTNILSFELDKTHGEICIAPSVARTQTKIFERNFDNYIAFLFIHGLMHLKGMDHGSTMERAEEKLRKQFGI